jgi:hypothetical protein
MGSHNLRLLAIAALVLSLCLHGAECGNSADTTHDTATATDTADALVTTAGGNKCYGPCAVYRNSTWIIILAWHSD